MRLIRVSTSRQFADILTKGLHQPQWKTCVEGILHAPLIPHSQVASVLKRGRATAGFKSSHVGP
jgi:hypothetical protein